MTMLALRIRVSRSLPCVQLETPREVASPGILILRSYVLSRCWFEILVPIEPALGYEEEENRRPVLSRRHWKSITLVTAFVHMQLPEVVDVRTTDKPEVSIKLKLQASSTRVQKLKAFRSAGRMFRRERPSSGCGIDRLVSLEHATRLPGVWFRSLRCTFSVR